MGGYSKHPEQGRDGTPPKDAPRNGAGMDAIVSLAGATLEHRRVLIGQMKRATSQQVA